jgi:hypothetical protein
MPWASARGRSTRGTKNERAVRKKVEVFIVRWFSASEGWDLFERIRLEERLKRESRKDRWKERRKGKRARGGRELR